jgi:predicted nucleic acid-binding protein
VGERPAVNASPLIFLARANLIELLQLAGTEIVVPTPVAEEILRRGPDDPAAQALSSVEWLTIADPPPIPEVVQGWDLGAGESSVLAWSYEHPGADCILDDLAARRCANLLGLPVRGTLGLVILGKRRGIFPKARPVLERMRRSGMYLSDRVLNRALSKVGE